MRQYCAEYFNPYVCILHRFKTSSVKARYKMQISEHDIRCCQVEFARNADDRLSNVFDKENHSRPKGGDIPIVSLQSCHGSVMGTGDRGQSFTAFDLVTRQRRVASCP